MLQQSLGGTCCPSGVIMSHNFLLQASSAGCGTPCTMHASPGLRAVPGPRAGTLTLNQLSVDKKSCLVMPGYDINDALKYGALSANIVSEEPIDMVLHESYEGNKTLWDDYTLEKFVPFNPTDKYTIAVVKEKASGKEHRIMKGAPQVGAARPPMLSTTPS